MNPTLFNDILNGCPCNEPKRTQCILRNTDYGYDHYLLLTNDQIRMVNYLLNEELLDTDTYTLIVLDEEGKSFEKV